MNKIICATYTVLSTLKNLKSVLKIFAKQTGQDIYSASSKETEFQAMEKEVNIYLAKLDKLKEEQASLKARLALYESNS